ncbi:MAG: NACHT and WD repeat domain-containing protein [Gammaproteobacteria bacterium]
MSASPFPGLRPFHRDEADIFFGRDEQVDQLISKLGRSRFLAVVGPSGCGKSSLIYTGLLNALEAGFLASAGLHWRTATLRPGVRPMENLAAALAEQAGFWSAVQPPLSAAGFSESDQTAENLHDRTAFLLATLRRGPLGLIEILREQPLAKDTNLLLVIDQFEEIFRYRMHQDSDEADAFVALLLRSVIDNDLPIYIVITMRSDFLGDCALFPGLPEAMNDSQFLTPRLSREQRRLAIIGPAKVYGGEVEPVLVNCLLNDMGADPDQLPVLQHALMRLWSVARSRGTNPVKLSLRDYNDLGGWEKTLSNHADEAYGELSATQQTIAEILLRSLSERSGLKRDTRRPVSLQTVAEIAGVEPEELIPVVEAFRRVDRSFLTPAVGIPLTPETVIDISHESLIRQWQRMTEWVDREARSAETYRRLEQTAILHGEKRAGYLHGLDLFPVIEWKKREKPNPAWAARYGKDFDKAMSFLTASVFRHDLKQIGKFLAFSAICVTAIAMAWLWRQAEIERDKASSARLLAEAQLVRSQSASQYPLSTLLAIEAVRRNSQPGFILNQFLRDSLGMLAEPLKTLPHGAEVYRVVYSPDAKWIATASDDRTARLWDAATGRQLQRLDHEDDVRFVTFSPDGTRLATASSDTSARVWDVATGRELLRLRHDKDVVSVAFSPDGSRIASASGDKTARLWDAATGQELFRLEHDNDVVSVAFSPDGARLASASFDTTARIWDVATGSELQRLSHGGYVNSVTFSSDGALLASSCLDNAARLWDLATGKELLSLYHDEPVNFVAFSPDDRSLASASWDRTARLWDASTGKELLRLEHEEAVNSVAFSPDGGRLASASADRTARLWDTATGQELKRLSHENNVYSVTFSPDGTGLATASFDHTARLWNSLTDKELLRLQDGEAVNSVAFSPDGARLAIASSDSSARVWNIAGRREMLRLNHESDVYAVTFNPAGTRLATASLDATARLWDAETGTELLRLKHDNVVYSVSFSPNGAKVVTASFDKTARLWDAATGSELLKLGHAESVNSATFSPDGARIATASWDNSARIWDLATGKQLLRLRHDSDVNFVTFNPDGTLIATASRDKTARIWEADTGKLLLRLGHEESVNSVAFSPDGAHLATVSLDTTARLWDALSGKELQRLKHEGSVNSVMFSHDGARLATASSDKTARIWFWQPKNLITQLCRRMTDNLSRDQWRTYFEEEPYRESCQGLPIPANKQLAVKR